MLFLFFSAGIASVSHICQSRVGVAHPDNAAYSFLSSYSRALRFPRRSYISFPTAVLEKSSTSSAWESQHDFRLNGSSFVFHHEGPEDTKLVVHRI